MLAAQLDWEIHQIDFNQAFLNGSLDEEIYMEQPEGFVVAAGKVCHLWKALYGLKQAGHQWFLALAACLEKIGFICHDTGDVCIFIHHSTEENVQILVVYVDDFTMMGNSLKLINQTKEALKGSFKLKDLGELKLYLGIRVTRDRGSKLVLPRLGSAWLQLGFQWLAEPPANEMSRAIRNPLKADESGL